MRFIYWTNCTLDTFIMREIENNRRTFHRPLNYSYFCYLLGRMQPLGAAANDYQSPALTKMTKQTFLSEYNNE